MSTFHRLFIEGVPGKQPLFPQKKRSWGQSLSAWNRLEIPFTIIVLRDFSPSSWKQIHTQTNWALLFNLDGWRRGRCRDVSFCDRNWEIARDENLVGNQKCKRDFARFWSSIGGFNDGFYSPARRASFWVAAGGRSKKSNQQREEEGMVVKSADFCEDFCATDTSINYYLCDVVMHCLKNSLNFGKYRNIILLNLDLLLPHSFSSAFSIKTKPRDSLWLAEIIMDVLGK